MWTIHDKFINEDDFKSEEDYLKYFDLYIQLKYEPINLEYENWRFFIKNCDKKFDNLRGLWGNKTIKSIELK